MQQDDRLVTIYKACGQPEAEVIKGRLTVEGIPAVLKYESVGSVYGLTMDGLGQVNVQVPTKYESKARAVIADSGEPEEPN
ncbi:MAG: DUF2007 domain-containing protein [Dehalococcoidia bacterium]|jgi:hypothetical protein